MLRKVILCPNPYRDAQLRVAKEAKRVLDEVGCPNVVCLPFRNQEPPEGYGLNIEPLQQEIRGADMIIAFGGDGTILHLARTVALHRVFNSPSDPIIFDVGHQCYTHKILTGRKDDFVTLRTEGGIAKVYLRGSLMVEDGRIVGGPEGQYLRRGLCTL